MSPLLATRSGEVEETLYLSEVTRVTRLRLPDGRRVIVKEMLGPNALIRVRHERRILERLAGVEGVPQLVEGTFPQEALAMRERGGEPIVPLLASTTLKVEEVVQYAARLAQVLAAVHRRGVAHRNLHPENLLILPDRSPLLIDFSLATTFAEKRPSFVHHRDITGNLPFLAPEQTGRTGRGVDQRADLYAFGATLYRMVTGTPPFEESDPLQLIHEILAEVPVPPLWRAPKVPRLLSDIIMRLLEKEPDRRYQSAQGVAHDLARLSLSLSDPEPQGFPLGERDFAPRLTPPSRLVGREREIALLKESFEGSLLGRGSCILISGRPGVGKSTLVNELRPLVAARRGFFASGKFDQYRQDLASDAVYQAIRALGRLFLAEPEGELALYRDRLLRGLGPNAPLIASLQPEFALLMGELPETAGVDSMSSTERLVQASVDHLRALSSPARPVVMVVDDLQWGAPAPLGFLREVAGSEPIPGFLLVGIFREPEGEELLSPILSPERGKGPPRLRLDNLGKEDLVLFLKEMLRLEPEQAAGMAAVVAERTGGNPYDTAELVNALRRDGLLSAEEEQGWSWDQEGIRRYLGHGDVLELLKERMSRLPAQALALLQCLACLGGEVEPELLALSSGISADELEGTVAGALEEGLVVAREDGRLRFSHDRVQQAALPELEEPSRPGLHLAMARRLSTRPGLEALAAAQYLQALHAIEERAEKRRVVSILQEGALRARIVNYRESERFLRGAISLLDQLDSPEDLPLRIRLETERCQALYSLGQLEEGDLAYQRIRELSPTPLQLGDAACIQICSLTNRSRHKEAVALGVELLRQLGVAVPEPALVAEEARGRLKGFYLWLESGKLEEEFRRPELQDPVARLLARLINRIIPTAFFCGEAMLSWWVVLESLRLWREHGPSPSLVGPLSHLGFVAICLADDFRKGGEAVKHVLAVSESRGWEPDTSQSRFLYSMTVGPWEQPLRLNVPHALRAEEGLLQGGDLLNASFTYYASIAQLLDCSPTLERFAAEAERAHSFALRTGNSHMSGSLACYRELARRLRDFPPEEEGEPPREEEQAPVSAAGWHLTEALWGGVMGDREALSRHARGAKKFFTQLRGNYSMAQGSLLWALSLSQQVSLAPPAEWEEMLPELDREIHFIAGRAEDCPAGFLHQLKWLEAERSWATGDLPGAMRSFNEALDLCQGRGLPWQEAMMTERASLFHRQCRMGHVSGILMGRARELYEEWGAHAKVRQLEKVFPLLRLRPARQGGEPPLSLSADSIDLLAILRASQALSSATSLERLTAQVVELLQTMTGATSVSLLSREERRGEWELLCCGSGRQGRRQSLREGISRGLIPLSLFNYVQRTREPLMVEDATVDDRFSHDPYLSGYPCCSILAVPILNQGEPRALLLLENRLSRGAFTADLLDAVTLIAGQLAVSLENALLYCRLEERVAERTAELQEAQSELMTAARLAGMAEVASNVLHNIGNVLNSVNISVGVVRSRLASSRVWGVTKSAELLEEHAAELGEFLTRDERGRLLPGYLKRLAQALTFEQQESIEELSRLSKSVEHIKEIVATQQSYARAGVVIEPVQLLDLVEDALRMNLGALSRRQVLVESEPEELPLLPLDRARVLQILVNLVANARQAMDELPPEERRLTLRVALCGERLRIAVSDRGEGIPAENLSRIFSHGFTTRKNGHGFGLHSCAVAAREMGGTLTVESAGRGEGACFTLEIPVKEGERDE